MKKNLFILSSAIIRKEDNSKDLIERIIQTLHSVESILSKVPNVEILILDNSNLEIPKIVYDIINHERVTILHTYPILLDEIEDSFMFSKEITNDYLKISYLKNSIESLTLEWYISNNDLSNFSRIFKMSARYFLLNDFNLEDHSGKNITLLKKTETNIGEDLTKSKYQYKCVLMSFSPEIQSEISESYKNIKNYIESQWRSKKGVGDIEHGLSLYVDSQLIKEVDRNGIAGKPNNEDRLIWI